MLEAVISERIPQLAVISESRIPELDEPELSFDECYENRLRVTAYSPAFVAPPEAKVFELRVYQSPSERHLEALHARFSGPEIPIFHRVGVVPILYASSESAAGMPNLTYLTPFESLAAREKAWAAFQADAEWQQVRQESIQRDGQIVETIAVTIYRLAPSAPK